MKERVETAKQTAGEPVQTLPGGGDAPPAPHPQPQAQAPNPPSAELERRFRELARKWRAETSHLSVAGRKVEHPAFREIVKMGTAAVPLLLAELRRQPGFWFLALEEITRADPVRPEDEGDVAAMSPAWVAWGLQQGHIT